MVTQVTLHPEGDFADLVFTSDLHRGSPFHQGKRARAHRQYIMDSPDRWTVDLGDDCDMNLKGSVGDGVYEQIISPDDQIDEMEDFWEDVAGAGKLLGMVKSNHLWRVKKEAGLDLTHRACRVLRVPDLGWSNVLSIKVGDNHQRRYTVFVRHGAGNARRPAGMVNSLMEMEQLVESCDAYVQGHLHNCWVLEKQYRRVGLKHLEGGSRWFANCGSFLSYDDSYADEKGYRPPDSRMVTLRLYKAEPKVECFKL